MLLLTRDDIIETFQKIYTRGFSFIASKISLSGLKRTKSSFNSSKITSSNWWIIPKLQERRNIKISGDKNISYEDYTVKKYLSNKAGLKMISLGSGVCSHEMQFAKHKVFDEVRCVDLSENILEEAKQISVDRGLENMIYESIDINSINLKANNFDLVLFHSSLHHFKNIDTLLQKVDIALKPDGLLIINEYVGPKRLAINKKQKQEINRILKYEIPKSYRKRIKTDWLKRKVSGPGLLRMLVADPSEAVESDKILPAIHKYFDSIEEIKLGGNITMFLFKDIAHHFINNDTKTQSIIDNILNLEDKFLENNPSTNVFGIYKKK